MKLSLITCTLRKEPRFDWMADSLARGARKHPEVEWELIVVDGQLWYQDDRNEKLMRAMEHAWDLWPPDGDPRRIHFVRHVKPKPTVWQGPHRLTSKDWFALCNARNTGLCLATGEHVVFFDDCTVLDEDFLHWHWRAAQKNVGQAGSFRSYTRATVEDGKVIDGEFHPGGIKDSRGDEFRKSYGGWLWGLNMSFPLEAALSVGGYDEKYDGQAGSEDCDFGVRLERLRCPLIYNPECLIYQILETHEPLDGHSSWTPVPEMERPRPKELVLTRDGIPHFANEKLIEILANDTARFWPLQQNYSLRELRALIQRGESFPVPTEPQLDWRDGQPLKEM